MGFLTFLLLILIHYTAGLGSIKLRTSRNAQTKLNQATTTAAPTSKSNFQVVRINEANLTLSKPSILYIPGIDGKGEYSFECLQKLFEDYECHRLEVQPEDRSSFITLARGVGQTLQSFSSPPILIGESFGGVLALYLGARYGKKISSIVVVNPATSLPRTPWHLLVPLLSKTGPLYNALGISTLLATATSEEQVKGMLQGVWRRVTGMSKEKSNGGVTMVMEALKEEFKPLMELPDSLPAETLLFRLGWLEEGNFLLPPLLPSLSATLPITILIGEGDRLLPSRGEGERLSQLMNGKVKVKKFEKGGHALLTPIFPLLDLLREVDECVRERPAATNIENISKVEMDNDGMKVEVEDDADADVEISKEEDVPSIDKADSESIGHKDIALGALVESYADSEDSAKKNDAITNDMKPYHGDTKLVQVSSNGTKSKGGAEGINSFENSANALPASANATRHSNKRRGIFSGSDLVLPPLTAEEIRLAQKNTHPFFWAASPLFYSTDLQGRVVQGLGGIPNDASRPILFVGNHQLMGLDLPLLWGGLMQGWGGRPPRRVRPLAHPLLFKERGDGGVGGGMELRKWGAVPVSPMNFYQLLKQKEAILLFPGGAKEALHKTGDGYKLFWPDRVDFLRMAAMMDAIIVPFAAIGGEESARILLDAEEVSKKMPSWLAPSFPPSPSPFLADPSYPSAANPLLPPILAPLPPSRFYFYFLPACDTRDLNKRTAASVDGVEDGRGGNGETISSNSDMRKSKMHQQAALRKTYVTLTQQVEAGIQSLLRLRASDPYRNFSTRFVKGGWKGWGKDRKTSGDRVASKFPAPTPDVLQSMYQVEIMRRQRIDAVVSKSNVAL
eukprot:gene31048-37527_t